MSDDLRERVARAIGESLRTARMSLESEGYLPEADAAIAVIFNETMEEAAMECGVQLPLGDDEFTEGYRLACEENARNIRARKKP